MRQEDPTTPSVDDTTPAPDGATPGQRLYDAWHANIRATPWSKLDSGPRSTWETYGASPASIGTVYERWARNVLAAGEPTLHEVTITVCSLCIDGAGGACHVPGCVFIFGRAPLTRSEGSTLREKIVGVGSIDGVTTFPEAGQS